MIPLSLYGKQAIIVQAIDGFEPHQPHCIVVFEQDTFILAKYWLNPGRLVPT